MKLSEFGEDHTYPYCVLAAFFDVTEEHIPLRSLIASLMSAALVVSFIGTADAGTKSKKYRHHDTHSQQYPYATPRQLQNLRAYERGEYYETLSDALPVGSRAWFEQKEREGGDRRF